MLSEQSHIAREWTYDFESGKFRNELGDDLTREELESAVSLGNPGESGVGISTLQRAVITLSALRAFEGHASPVNVLEAAQRGVSGRFLDASQRRTAPAVFPSTRGDG
jgi:hypothetical protein